LKGKKKSRVPVIRTNEKEQKKRACRGQRQAKKEKGRVVSGGRGKTKAVTLYATIRKRKPDSPERKGNSIEN